MRSLSHYWHIKKNQLRPWWGKVGWSLLVLGLPFIVYLRTLAPTVYGLDSAELTTGAYVLGIVHPPGSPLFLLIGHLFTYLPVGDVGYRLNLLSALAAASAALFVFYVLRHLTGQRFLPLISAWFLAFTYYFWASAVAAELYALNAFFVTVLIWMALKWRELGLPWRLITFAFLFGLSLGNHLSISLLGPGFVLLTLSAPTQPLRKPLLILETSLAGLLGLQA